MKLNSLQRKVRAGRKLEKFKILINHVRCTSTKSLAPCRITKHREQNHSFLGRHNSAQAKPSAISPSKQHDQISAQSYKTTIEKQDFSTKPQNHKPSGISPSKTQKKETFPNPVAASGFERLTSKMSQSAKPKRYPQKKPTLLQTARSQIKHAILDAVVHAIAPVGLRLLHRRRDLLSLRSRTGLGGCGIVLIQETVDIAATALACQVRVVGWWADRNALGGTAEKVAQVMRLKK